MSRLSIQRLFITFVGITLLTALVDAKKNTNSCLLLHQEKAKFWKSYVGSSILKNKKVDSDKIFESIEKLGLSPHVSECLGSMDLSLSDVVWLVSGRECRATASLISPTFNPPFKNDFVISPTLEKIFFDVNEITRTNGPNFLQAIEDILQYFLKYTEKDHLRVAEDMRSKVVPCFQAQLLKLLYNKVINRGNCCIGLKDAFKTAMGGELEPNYVGDIMLQLGDMVFTLVDNKTPCSFIAAQGASNSSNPLNGVQDFMNTPNDQACASANGQNFTTIRGDNVRYEHPLGCCASYRDSFTQFVADLPIVEKFLLPEVFEADKCANAMDVPLIQNTFRRLSDGIAKEKVVEFFDGLCLHLANDYSQTCNYIPNSCSSVSSVNAKREEFLLDISEVPIDENDESLEPTHFIRRRF